MAAVYRGLSQAVNGKPIRVTANLTLIHFANPGTPLTITGRSNDGGGHALFTTSTPHGLVVGGLIGLYGFDPTYYNRCCTVETTPSATTFTALSVDEGVHQLTYFAGAGGFASLPTSTDWDQVYVQFVNAKTPNASLAPGIGDTRVQIYLLSNLRSGRAPITGVNGVVLQAGESVWATAEAGDQVNAFGYVIRRSA